MRPNEWGQKTSLFFVYSALQNWLGSCLLKSVRNGSSPSALKSESFFVVVVAEVVLVEVVPAEVVPTEVVPAEVALVVAEIPTVVVQVAVVAQVLSEIMDALVAFAPVHSPFSLLVLKRRIHNAKKRLALYCS